MMKNTQDIIRKWYRLLGFPGKYDRAFEAALIEYDIPEDTCIETYDLTEKDGKKNLLSFLFMCEHTEQLYREKEIDREILIATLRDLLVLTDTFYDTGKELYLGELEWLKLHLTCRLFKLGRLQFAFGEAEADSPSRGLVKGEPVVEVHIDATAPLLPAECDRSFAQAEAFFPKYFPDCRFRFYSCASWLLAGELEGLLPDESNIMQFRRRFDIIGEQEKDDILQYVFLWNTTRETIADAVPRTSFAKAVKQQALEGKTFHVGCGLIPHP